MGDSSIRNPQFTIRNQPGPPALPRWWRLTLIALALLVLCSCQALPPEALPPEMGARLPVGDTEVSDRAAATATKDGPAPTVLRSPRASEVRALGPEEIAASRPLSRKEVAAGWATPASCNCPGCGDNSCGGSSCGIGCEIDACATCPMPALVGPPDEYLCDGGDDGLPAAVRADWAVDGLEPEDAIAHYDTIDGRVIVTPSNRVCIYAPRFAAVRRVENLLAHERRQLIDIAVEDAAPVGSAEVQPVVASTQRTGVAINLGERPANLFRGREQAAEYVQVIAPGEFYNTVGPYAILETLRTGEVVGTEIPAVKRIVQNAIAWTGDQGPQVVFSNRQAVAVVGLKQPGVVYQTDEPGDPRLRLIKCASTNHALPGEEVDFMLRFDNIGNQTIGNVTIIDNLTTRLEYVPETAKSTVESQFSSVPNGTGSTVLRWEIKDPVKPGEGGVLSFKSRVK
ncbi:MAG: hypothetical protein AB7G28_04780 [Pirellulales bacterium]